MSKPDARRRLQAAMDVHGGDGFSSRHAVNELTRPLFYWAWGLMWLRDAAHVAASLALDGVDVKELP